jgi:hypothetical protein
MVCRPDYEAPDNDVIYETKGEWKILAVKNPPEAFAVKTIQAIFSKL